MRISLKNPCLSRLIRIETSEYLNKKKNKRINVELDHELMYKLI